MKLRHLRYFVAVAEVGSLTVAAERKLHTSQPLLTPQIRDLGRRLPTRSARIHRLGLAKDHCSRARLHDRFGHFLQCVDFENSLHLA